MTKRITLVIDVADPGAAEFYKSGWNVDTLVADLAAADKQVEASVFVGKLEEAPESWAYLLYIDDAALRERTKVAAMKQRLAKTIGTDMRHLVAGKIAEYYGMLGAMDASGRSWSAKKAGALYVKKDIAKKLKWPIEHAEENDQFVQTAEGVKLPLPKLIVKYLDAALPAAT